MDRLREAEAFRNRLFQRLPALESEGHCRVPNQRFWDHYKANKDLYYDACIGVRKVEGVWLIVVYDLVDHEAEAEREIQEMLSRHESECGQCQSLCVIEKHIMRNGYPCYRFFCESCVRRTSGLLPHALVDYLWQYEGREILDRYVSNGTTG